MTAAKGRKPVTKAGGSQGSQGCRSSRSSRSKDTGKESVELLFKEVGLRMKSLSGDDPGDAGQAFDYVGIIGLLDQIIAIEPGNRNALNYKGIMLMGMQEQEKSLECFNAILKSNPGDSEALNNKAIALYGLGRASEAMTYVDKAIEIDKRYADALMNKAVMLHDLGQTEEARKYLARANACDRISP
jgi:tetratricopeptide (TPR) repeat protein